MSKRKTRVKICGITDPKAALVAAEAGADMIGMIFVKGSARCATIEQGKAISHAVRKFREMDVPVKISLSDKQAIDNPKNWFDAQEERIAHLCDSQMRPLIVGVFMDQSAEEVNRIAFESGVDLIQLHGNESNSFEARCILPVLRVVHVDPKHRNVQPNHLVEGPAAMLLFDTAIDGAASGGSGKTFDWNIVKSIKQPLILAGGLTPDNVGKAIKVGRPWGVDVSSGVEKARGIKDYDKIREFIRQAAS